MKYNLSIVRAFFRAQGLSDFVTEHQFARSIFYIGKDGRVRARGWAFDFAWLEQKIALEVEGGVWIGGGHNRGKGFVKDIEKYNSATLLGWRILRCEPKQVCMTTTVEMIKKALTL